MTHKRHDPRAQTQALRPAAILTKLEYMPALGEECGPEVVTKGEGLKWWLHATLRPQALLLVGKLLSVGLAR